MEQSFTARIALLTADSTLGFETRCSSSPHRFYLRHLRSIPSFITSGVRRLRENLLTQAHVETAIIMEVVSWCCYVHIYVYVCATSVYLIIGSDSQYWQVVVVVV